MAENTSPLEMRFAALEARLAQQDAEISRLRHQLACQGQRAWLPALAGILGLLLACASWMLPAAVPVWQSDTGGVAWADTGASLLLGHIDNEASTPNDTTGVHNPSHTALMTRTVSALNYTNQNIADVYKTGFRTALLGSTSGTDTSSETVTRVGVMGLVDQGGYGVYGASRSGTGVTGISDLGVGGEFSGKQAQLRLVPGPTAGPPSDASHLTGELYLDSQGNLYLCNAGSPNPRWTKLNVVPSYLPTIARP